jgi:hypothetical protein
LSVGIKVKRALLALLLGLKRWQQFFQKVGTYLASYTESRLKKAVTTIVITV